MNYRISPRAERELSDIVDYIRAYSPAAALRLADRMRNRFRQLALHPHSGPPRPDLGPGFRHLVVGNYLVLYRVQPDRVEVVRVLHGRRDLGSLIGPE